MASGALGRFARFYNSNFDRRPIPTLIVTNGVLYTISDVLAQTSAAYLHKPTAAEPSHPGFDFERTIRFAVFGMAMGPLIGRWMKLLDRGFPMRAGGRGNGLQLAKRVAADQLIIADMSRAPLGMVLFVGGIGAMEGKSFQQIQEKFSGMFVPAIIANWKVWPLIQTINFKLMPLQYRVPFQSTCGIAWVLYLSLLNASKGGS